MQLDPRVAPVARCLAQLDGRFIGAADWEGSQRQHYEERARRVLQTVDNVAAGNRTGGLPPSIAGMFNAKVFVQP